VSCDFCGTASIKDTFFQCARCPEGQFDICAKCAASTTCSRVPGEDHALLKYSPCLGHFIHGACLIGGPRILVATVSASASGSLARTGLVLLSRTRSIPSR
jgi:hypothetical protein